MENNELGERVAALEKDAENIHTELAEIKNQNQAIYEIATSVKVIATDLQNVKETVAEVKLGQDSLGRKLDEEIDRVKSEQDEIHERIDEVDQRDAKEAHAMLKDFGRKAAWLLIGAVLTWLVYQAFPFLQ